MAKDLKLSVYELLIYGVIYSSQNQTYVWGQTYLSEITGITIATLKRALKNMIEKGLIIKVSHGYQIVSQGYQKVSEGAVEENTEKYQSDTGKYQSDTKKVSEGATYINTTITEDIKEEIKEEKKPVIKKKIENRFEEFWNEYPLKKGKTKAIERYKQAMSKGVSEDTLIQKAKEYAEECKIKGTETRYIKRAEGWLNSGRYEDTYITKKPKQVKSEDKPYDFEEENKKILQNIRPMLPGIAK